MWKDEGDLGQPLNNVTPTPDDAIIWTENEFKFQLIWYHQFFKTLAGVWINNGPGTQQTGTLPICLRTLICYQGSTILAKSNVRNLSSLDNRQRSHGADPSKVKVSSAICWGFPEKRRQVSEQEWDQL